jgi:sigma-B regulation protein RsbU (phosphoserine phosphatase)
VRLAPGDALLLYTDGVTESRNAAGEEYGPERLELAALSHARRPGREILDACLADLQGFRQDVRREDDQTLLVLKRVVTGQ